jgi:hypothetical protein
MTSPDPAILTVFAGYWSAGILPASALANSPILILKRAMAGKMPALQTLVAHALVSRAGKMPALRRMSAKHRGNCNCARLLDGAPWCKTKITALTGETNAAYERTREHTADTSHPAALPTR